MSQSIKDLAHALLARDKIKDEIYSRAINPMHFLNSLHKLIRSIVNMNQPRPRMGTEGSVDRKGAFFSASLDDGHDERGPEFCVSRP